MALNIISNYAANVAHRNLSNSDEMATRSLAKLSSGTRVVSARDDAASMAIGARLNATTESLKTASVNVGQANAMLQIADGGMATVDDVLVRMKTLATQAASGNLSNTERGFLNDEFTSLRDEIDRVAASTTFNGIQLLGAGAGVESDPGLLGSSLSTAIGFQGFEFAANSPVAAGDTVEFQLTEGPVANTIIMTLNGSGGQTQSIDVTEYMNGGSQAIGTGQTAAINFSELGLTVTLNENFSAAGRSAGIIANDNDFDASGAGDAAADRTLTVRAASGGAALAAIDFQIGSGNTANDRVQISLTSVSSTNLGTSGGGAALNTAQLDNQTNAQNAIDIVSASIDDLQGSRAAIGVSQNRLDFAGQNLATTIENNESARSTLMDLDVAAEMTKFTSKQILVQSGVAMLSQANQMPQNLLRLLQ